MSLCGRRTVQVAGGAGGRVCGQLQPHTGDSQSPHTHTHTHTFTHPHPHTHPHTRTHTHTHNWGLKSTRNRGIVDKTIQNLRKILKNRFGKPLSTLKSAKKVPKRGPRDPKGAQKATRGLPRRPQGAPRRPQGAPRRPKAPPRSPKGSPKGSQRDPQNPPKRGSLKKPPFFDEICSFLVVLGGKTLKNTRV